LRPIVDYGFEAILVFFFVATLVLGSQPRQRGLQGYKPRGSPGVKAKRSQGCGPRKSPGVTSHTLRSVRKYEGV